MASRAGVANGTLHDSPCACTNVSFVIQFKALANYNRLETGSHQMTQSDLGTENRAAFEYPDSQAYIIPGESRRKVADEQIDVGNVNGSHPAVDWRAAK